MQYPRDFESALSHCMLYEVGGFWRVTPEVEAGLIQTPQQRRAVGYVNDPLDNGGETKFGVAQNANPEYNISTLTWAQAKEIYYRKYWLVGRCDKLNGRVAIMHFDCCVNHGVKRASIFIQRALGVVDDGQIGPITIAKTLEMDSKKLCVEIADQREKFYHRIVQHNPQQNKFLRGWLARGTAVKNFVLGL